MQKKQFSQTEKKIKELFSSTDSFDFQNTHYTVRVVGKPSPSIGECKTDIYILAEDKEYNPKEFKISIKQKNADFLENKMSLERAIEIFGLSAQKIIFDHTATIKKDFEQGPLVFFTKKGNTNAKSITLGWKFEILNKVSKNKSGVLKLTTQQKIEVYAGQNLSTDKKNSKINGLPVTDSGVANFLLVVDSKEDRTLKYYVNQLIPIEDYVKEKEFFFACKALNYRAEKDKWDGNRPLCVYVDWQLEKGTVKANLVYENPLSTKGNEVGNKVRRILKTLKITNDNFLTLEQYLDEKIIKYKHGLS